MKKGFTLLELILVVMLMGIVYGSVINVFERYKAKTIDVDFMTLQKYMQDFAYNSHVSLVCIKACSECLMLVEGKFMQNVTPFMDKELRLYRYNKESGVREFQPLPYFTAEGDEEEACFRYDLYPDGSRSEMIVKDGKEVYLFSSYFGSVQKLASLEKAVEYYSEMARKVAEK